MMIGGSEAPRTTVAGSAAATDDGQSARQLNVAGAATTAGGSEAAATSFRNLTTVERGTSSSQRRGNLVLFVKSNDNESDAPSRAMNNASLYGHSVATAASGNTSVRSHAAGDDSTEGGGDAEQEGLLSVVVSTAASGGSTVVNAVTGAARKPLLTAAIVLLYFILLDIVLLQGNERLNRLLRRVRGTDDDALVLLTSSLVRQMAAAQQELESTLAEVDPPATLERLEAVQHKAAALERVCNRSVHRLHTKLMFPGSAADLLFLVEQHVAFDAQVERLAREELEWTSTVTAATLAQKPDDAAVPRGTAAGAMGAAQASASGGGSSSASAKEKGENADDLTHAELQANPLRNVRLERVVQPGSSSPSAASAAAHLSAQSRSRREQSAAAMRKAAKDYGKAAATTRENVSGVEAAAEGLLDLLKNRFVAFALICALLAALLRMG